ncbi:MAG: hypothetical protein ACOCQR_01065 [bacterium]
MFKLIGDIPVDSGQVLVADPQKIKSLWRDRDGAAIEGIKFWGAGEKEVKQSLEEKGYLIEETQGGTFFISLRENTKASIKDIKAYIQKKSKEIGKIVVSHIRTNCTYDIICDSRDNYKQGANIIIDNKYLGVCFSSGYGDGCYDVFLDKDNFKCRVVFIQDMLEGAKKRHIGSINIESNQVAVIDPCYIESGIVDIDLGKVINNFANGMYTVQGLYNQTDWGERICGIEFYRAF